MKLFFVILISCIIIDYTKSDNLPSIYEMHFIRVICHTKSESNFVISYMQDNPQFDFVEMTNPYEILVPKIEVQSFIMNLNIRKIKFEVLYPDAGKVINRNAKLFQYRRFKRNYIIPDILDSFPRYDEIKMFVETFAKNHSDVVTNITIGKSSENRSIIGVKISSGKQNNPAILIEAGIHAREWIAPTTALYAMKQLVEVERNVFQNVDVYIIPLLNPDGYEFSHQNDDVRNWRKTVTVNDGKCIGVDANRNFDYHWGGVGSSDDKCSPFYRGPKPFSESESRALRDLIESLENVQVYVGLHSYASAILYPWGNKIEVPQNNDELKCVATKAADKYKTIRGSNLKVNNSISIYPHTGSSLDWVYSKGISYSYVLELPSNEFRFMAPPEEIIPIGKEAFEALKVFIKAADVRDCKKI